MEGLQGTLFAKHLKRCPLWTLYQRKTHGVHNGHHAKGRRDLNG